jgi:hypothetical protein
MPFSTLLDAHAVKSKSFSNLDPQDHFSFHVSPQVLPMANEDTVGIFALWDYSTCLRDLAGRTIAVETWDLAAGDSMGHTTEG